MADPKVSIIIPVYNGANYMAEAIDSALAQTYPDCEVLVINDGSTDNGVTRKIASSYGDRIRYFEKENGGVASALNRGIREMKGGYFSWLSHDDRYLPDKVGKQVEFIKYFELEGAVVFSDYHIIDAGGNRVKTVKMPFTTPEGFYYYLYLHCFLHGCTLLIPRELLLAVDGFPEQFATTQDYELWMRLCRRAPFVHQAEAFVEGRHHDEQGSKRMSMHNREVRQFFDSHLQEVLEHAVATHYLGEEAIPGMLGEIVFTRLKQKKWRSALFAASAAFRYPGALSSVGRGMVDGTAWLLKTKRKKQALRKVWNAILGREKTAEGARGGKRVDFKDVYARDGFRGVGESASGGGSTLWTTRIVRRELPALFERISIKSMLDIPCGDFNWMRQVPLGDILYTGGDLVEELIARNREKYADGKHFFQALNLLDGPLPRSDLVLCRDCFGHMPLQDVWTALKTIKASGATWLLTTTYPEHGENVELAGTWRPLNLNASPFFFPKPAASIDEKCSEAGGLFRDKLLALWKLDDISVPQRAV